MTNTHVRLAAVTSNTQALPENPRAQIPELEIGDARVRRDSVDPKNVTHSMKQELVNKFQQLLDQCAGSGAVCVPGPPGRPGPQGVRGRRGQKGRSGRAGPRGIMGPPGPAGKQGIMGPAGEKGAQGEKGDAGPPGMSGSKGDPGESLSSPDVIVSPLSLTVNEREAASLQCSASGNPVPKVVWSRVNGSLPIGRSAVFGGKLEVQNSEMNDSGVYQCEATNILGAAHKRVQLVVNGEGSDWISTLNTAEHVGNFVSPHVH